MDKTFLQNRITLLVSHVFFQMFVIIFLFWERNVLAETKPPIIYSPKQADSLVRILQTSSLDDTNRVKTCLLLAKYHRTVRRNFDSALFYINDAYERAMRVNFKHGLASAHIERAMVFHFQSKNSLSENNAYSALTLFRDLNDQHGIADAYTLLGMIYTHWQFNYSKAVPNLLKAIYGYQQLGDTVASKNAVHHLGWIYDNVGYNSQAIEYYSKALHLSEIEGNRLWIAYAAYTLANVYIKTEQFVQAELMLNLAREIYLEVNDKAMMVQLDIAKGALFAQQGSIMQAKELFERALRNAENINDIGTKILSLKQLASIHGKLNNHKQALSYAQGGYVLCDSVEWGQKLPRAEFLMILSKSYEALGYPQKALECYRDAEIINNSVLNANTLHQLEKLTLQSEFEKQEQTIALLKAEESIKDSELRIKRLTQSLWIATAGVLTIALLWLYKHYREKKKVAQNLTVQNSFLAYKSQMQEVESQLAPHFLFNSLSALGGLISRNAKKEAIEFLENLALTYRYVLTHKQQHLVTLEAEVDFVNAYVYLFTTRFRDGLQIQLDIDKKFNHYVLPPMTLQLLVENAVKHNIATANQPLHIAIQTEGNETEAQLVVRNNLQLLNSQAGHKAMMSMVNNLPLNTPNKEATHVGLQNLALRYQLFARRLPSIEKTETEFVVSVPILSPEEAVSVS